MSKIPKNTDGYVDSNGHLVIPFPNAVAALAKGLPMTVWIKDKNSKGKLLTTIAIPSKS